MKKWIALLLSLLLLGCGALAESAEPQLVPLDFGDFTLTLDPNTQGQYIQDKVSGETFLALIPDYNENDLFHGNINAVWSEGYSDLAAADANQMAEEITSPYVEAFQAQGIEITSTPQLSAMYCDEGEYPYLLLILSFDTDYTKMGYDMQPTLYMTQLFFSEEAFGTYCFTATADSMDGLKPLLNILDTLEWVK